MNYENAWNELKSKLNQAKKELRAKKKKLFSEPCSREDEEKIVAKISGLNFANQNIKQIEKENER